MSLTKLGFCAILFFVISIQLVNTQYWDLWGSGRCYGRNERYAQCASTCPDTCEDIRRPNPMKICTMMCRSGCECIPPFVRMTQSMNSPCVYPSQCRFWY